MNPPLLYTLPLMVLFFFSSACKNEDDATGLLSSASLEKLEVGQKLKYRSIRVDFANTGAGLEKDCYYGNETLTLEVLRQTSEGLIIAEYTTGQDAEAVGEQLLSIKNQTVEVVQLEEKDKYGPSLFHQKTFSIVPILTPVGRIEENCFYNIDTTGAANFAIEQAKIGTQSYSNLSVYRFDEAMKYDGPGYTYLFGENAVLLRSTTYGGFFPYLKGWELVVEK